MDVRRIGQAKVINLIPLHGVGKNWEAAVHIEFHTISILRAEQSCLRQILRRCVGRLSPSLDFVTQIFHGDQNDQNLFARIVRGELEQWRIWEDENRAAFLTPSLCRDLHSDVFRLDNTSYNAVLHLSLSWAS